jgi:hypothetical protein
MFKEKFGSKEPQNMSELLARAQLYINYEKELIADWGKKVKIPSKKGEN